MSINHDEKGTEGAGGKIWQDITRQIKWLGQSIRLLGILIYTFGITFQQSQNYDIRQPFGPEGGRLLYLFFRLWSVSTSKSSLSLASQSFQLSGSANTVVIGYVSPT